MVNVKSVPSAMHPGYAPPILHPLCAGPEFKSSCRRIKSQNAVITYIGERRTMSVFPEPYTRSLHVIRTEIKRLVTRSRLVHWQVGPLIRLRVFLYSLNAAVNCYKYLLLAREHTVTLVKFNVCVLTLCRA